jgi:four helix bundle protein
MDYQNLAAWQRAMELCDEVYRVAASFPKSEVYELSSQLRQSAVSVPSNIAEGEGRMTRGERKQFHGHARGSLYEVETQLLIARRVGYAVTDDAFKRLRKAKNALEGYIAWCDKRPP